MNFDLKFDFTGSSPCKRISLSCRSWSCTGAWLAQPAPDLACAPNLMGSNLGARHGAEAVGNPEAEEAQEGWWLLVGAADGWQPRPPQER